MPRPTRKRGRIISCPPVSSSSAPTVASSFHSTSTTHPCRRRHRCMLLAAALPAYCSSSSLALPSAVGSATRRISLTGRSALAFAFASKGPSRDTSQLVPSRQFTAPGSTSIPTSTSTHTGRSPLATNLDHLHRPRTRLFSLAPNAATSAAMGPIEDTTAAQADALGNDDDHDNINPGSAAGAESVQARRVAATPHSLSECGDRLRSGDLVSFPTETVYGLGCHALDPEAVSKVFRAKERPLSDPLIVHVTNTLDAMKLWDASASKTSPNDISVEGRALNALCDAFWPGPLTIVAKAAPSVPGIVMAGTGYVACRSPSHPVARALIDAAQVPIAAPSANKFGHVSPTRADHVLDDLGAEDVWVVDPSMASEGGEGEAASREAVCNVGVESTVAKVEMSSEDSGKVVILRHGAVSTTDVRRALEKVGLTKQFEVLAVVRSTGDHVAHVAPGQTIRHYSPDVVSYMISHSRYGQGMELGQEETAFLSQAVVIDFAGRLGALKDYALAYRDLSSEGDSSEAASKVFDALRWAEDVQGAERVYFPEIVVSQSASDTARSEDDKTVPVGEEDALTLAVKDRLTRAASGVVIDTLQ
mmetsp:Transcript_778/g.2172  ORF Transcript_778/g.2172 Transcript_778/m.2172 type:complete len:590 (+) Transcript_778:106-1875(+)